MGAQLRIAAALHDAKDLLARRTRLLAAFLRPTNGPLDSEQLVLRRRIVRRALVENHRDVGAEVALDFHRLLRAEEELRAIEVRAELDAVLPDLANLREAEDLEAAAVGEYRERPVHEAVQAARRADDVHAGADAEMVGVAEDDLRAHLDQLARVQRLHAALRADGHKDGRINDAMWRGEAAQPRLGTRIRLEQLEHRRRIQPQHTQVRKGDSKHEEFLPSQKAASTLRSDAHSIAATSQATRCPAAWSSVRPGPSLRWRGSSPRSRLCRGRKAPRHRRVGCACSGR